MFIRSWRATIPALLLGAMVAGQAAAQGRASTPAPIPIEASPFVESVRLGYVAKLTHSSNETLLSTEKLLLRIEGDRVKVDPVLLEGLHVDLSRYPDVLGNLPRSAWLLTERRLGRMRTTSLLHFTGAEWVDADSTRNYQKIIAISPWSSGRALVLVADDHEQLVGFKQLGGPGGAALPRLEFTARNGYQCAHGIKPMVLRALPTDEVFLAGARCFTELDYNVTDRGLAVERWGSGQLNPKIDILPDLSPKEAASGELTSLVVVSGHEAFVAGSRTPLPLPLPVPAAPPRAYIAHFDGRAWHAQSAPPVERIDDLQRSPNGQLWALSKGDLWVTTQASPEVVTWTLVPIPRAANDAGEHAVTSFWVRGDHDVCATLGSAGFSYLLRTKRGAEPLSAPSEKQVAELTQGVDRSALCDSVSFVLFALSRNAPKDADFPSVRAALRNHPEFEGKLQLVEVPFLTRRYLAVRNVPGQPDLLAPAIGVLLDSNIPGIHAELRCLAAPPTRVIPLDFGSPTHK